MSHTPILEYDKEANAFYLRFSDAEVDDTIPLSDAVYVDLDANGDPIGIEILHATPDELPNRLWRSCCRSLGIGSVP